MPAPVVPGVARPRMLRQFELIEKVRSYDPTADEAILNRAYVYAMRQHGSQKRASGDPYFAHPLEVAGILTAYRLDTETIVTALLHDVIEDTDATREQVAELFGAEVAELVEGVTKLSKLELSQEHLRQAENLRKFILAISKDVRVLLVKLADRLHNMRTLHFIKQAAKRERIARETLDIYGPLARSIGVHRICEELEELAFAHLNPVARNAILRRLETLRHEQGGAVSLVSQEISARLDTAGIPARVFGREKHAYSIWRKLQRKSIGFSQLSDIYAFRVIVENEDDCYRALGVIHRAWPSVPERFKDFISTPKRNNYRSLHTTVVGYRGMRIEMQIRTEAMDRVAEEGVAAHWRYKNESYGFDAEHQKAAGGRDPLVNLRHLVQVLEHGGDAEELVEHAKLEMFLDQVFVFTPKGQLVSLPRGGMPLDFAYAVHTDIGDTTIGVKINGELKPLRTALVNGDVVEVIRGGKPVVPPDWRSLTVTGRARRYPPPHPPDRARRVRPPGSRHGGPDLRVRRQVAQGRLATPRLRPLRGRHRRRPVRGGRPGPRHAGAGAGDGVPGPAGRRAGGGDRAASHRGRCGRAPLRPRRWFDAGRLDPLRGMLLACAGRPHCGHHRADGRGLTVHTIDCETLAHYEDREELWRDLQWTPEAERNTVARARLTATIKNAPGVLGQVCTVIGEAGGNIVGLRMHHRQSDFFGVDFDVEVTDARHLTHISAALRANPSVEDVERAKG